MMNYDEFKGSYLEIWSQCSGALLFHQDCRNQKSQPGPFQLHCKGPPLQATKFLGFGRLGGLKFRWDFVARRFGHGSKPIVPYFGGWTSIYHLFWCSLEYHGFDPWPFHPISSEASCEPESWRIDDAQTSAALSSKFRLRSDALGACLRRWTVVQPLSGMNNEFVYSLILYKCFVLGVMAQNSES